MKYKTTTGIFALTILALLFSVSCSKSGDVTSNTTFLPLSDQNNSGDWILNEDVSDEFDASILDESKWLIQGRNGEYQSNHTGRAPSQFSTENVRLENGYLKMETRWEPDYNFSPQFDRQGNRYENITTAAIITKKSFKYGYLEIKAKAADAEVSSTFWGTGSNTELDFYEFFGKHNQQNKLWKEREFWWSIHDWTSQGGGATTYTESHDLGFRVADDFHIYGFDWSEKGIKIYIDGQLYRDVSKTQINAFNDSSHHSGGNGESLNYVVTKPIKLWISQATFPWHGVPDNIEELGTNGIVDYEVDYLRVWQKSD
ncbi:MAG: family 16 glycosylhydrolase [Wenyingzhuangia sp.]|jgi:beta-glucanase (GH16 family)|uniref:family 16 glycosylhydrolase n=1 Tax=Wenyingzhuangia sp. TaxID=1964193 RepID=UPI002339557D|nr:family 16 glycosylhydrolase [Flavobacteriaceae bacterium]